MQSGEELLGLRHALAEAEDLMGGEVCRDGRQEGGEVVSEVVCEVIGELGGEAVGA